MDWFEPWTHENEDLGVDSPMEGYGIDYIIDINPHASRARNNDNLYKDTYGDLIQPNPTDNASGPAQPENLPGTDTDANVPRQPPQNGGIELNNSCMQLPLPEDWACYAYGIYPSERLTNTSGCGINPLCDQPEQLRYSNLPEYEAPNSHSTMAPQREHAQVHSALAPGSLLQAQTSNAFGQTIQSLVSSFVQTQATEPMQVYLPNGPPPSISNQSPTTEQQPTSSRYGQPPTTGGPRLIKVITDEEIDGLRKLKPKEDRRKRTENPDPEHKKEIRKAGSKAHHERNLEEKTELNSMKQRLEELIKIKKSSRVKGINLYNEMQEKKDIEESLKQLKMDKKKIEEQMYKLEVDKLYSRKHRKNKALERIRLRNENKRLKSTSSAPNPAVVNRTPSAEINGNKSRDIFTTTIVSTRQTGSSNAADERLPEGWKQPSNQPRPAGWEMENNFFEQTYHFDHNTCSARWQHPVANMHEAHEQWQSGRDQAMQHWGQRFLLQQGNGAAGEVAVKNDDPLGPLPEGWEKRVDTSGRVYFFNDSNQTTHWEDPRIQGAFDQPLPEGWNMQFTDQGVPFFANYTRNTFTYNNPWTGKPVGPIVMAGRRTFYWKIAQFRHLCLSNSAPNPVEITVSRTRVFTDSFREIMHNNPIDLRRRLYIQFRGEEGLDYGGVAREWFFLLSHEVLNPMYCLFMYAGNNNYSLQINPASFANPDHLKYFEFIGRFIAMALFHGKFIYSGFTMPFYKKMLNKRITLKDIEQVDFELYNSMTQIKDSNVDERNDLYFLAYYELLGEWETHELKSGGAEIRVTEANKNEYIDLSVKWRFNRGVEQQTQAFFNGFNSVFPLEWLQNFDERELELLLCGMQEIDVDDWQRNTEYSQYAPESEQVIWFWYWVRSLNQEKRARLLQFVTGTCRVPVGGFFELMGSTGPKLFCIERVGKENWLPRSHTCFNRLDLPPYRSYDQLSEKLTIAIDNTEGFGNE
ncbi:hypothetical protein WR25_26197 [Diploscapter pachys]|uniref:HECT-type E3 ubiquitin transferase n=1 Tax=Diploscapter pachys TaxID=2018661 RepID=A0A2A2LGB2_9BILA|nr:hypothetical protein WR25_26197 [Diploscapter pachys]